MSILDYCFIMEACIVALIGFIIRSVTPTEYSSLPFKNSLSNLTVKHPLPIYPSVTILYQLVLSF